MASSDKYKSCVGQEEKRDGRRGRKAELVMMQKEIGHKDWWLWEMVQRCVEIGESKRRMRLIDKR